MNQNRKSVHEKTREIYLKQHKQYTRDNVFFDRFLKMSSDPSYYHLTKKDFKGKTVLDAGCGNSAYLEVALLNFGVSRITCLDLGTEWIPHLKKIMKNYTKDNESLDYIAGSTTKLPFVDNSFDFVFSNGVLMHLLDKKEIDLAFRELARVTKKGGYLYIVLGCPRGLFEEEVFPAVRRYYHRNPEFKKFIDTISPNSFMAIFEDIVKNILKHTGEKISINKERVSRLVDLDFCTWIQNVTQVPKRHILDLDEKYAISKYKLFGFETPKCCKRYVKRQNIRKYFAPLHYYSENRIAKLLYGPGNLEYIARKK